jgi:hypothetical protein
MSPRERPHTVAPMLASIVNLNGHAGYVHWKFIDISVPNVIVIVLMLVVFVIALLAPFPGSHRSGEKS